MDGGGLTGKIRERGGKIIVQFEYRYRSKDKIRQIVCGTWPDKSLKAIREKRDEYRSSVNNGDDPLDRNQAARLRKQMEAAEAVATEQARLTELQALKARIPVTDLFERWATVELVRRKDQGKEIRRMFEKDVLPLIGALAVEDVRTGHVIAVTDALLARGVTRMAKLIFSLIRQMFRFAVDRDIIEADPTAAIRKAKIGGKESNATGYSAVTKSVPCTGRFRQVADRDFIAPQTLWLLFPNLNIRSIEIDGDIGNEPAPAIISIQNDRLLAPQFKNLPAPQRVGLRIEILDRLTDL